jgi:peptidoglycan/LPS O-acetylase OafA/YrhL
MRYVGLISYPMYLYHAIGGAFGRRIPGANAVVEFAGALLATGLIASGSYFFVEKPWLRYRDSRSAHAPKRAGAFTG